MPTIPAPMWLPTALTVFSIVGLLVAELRNSQRLKWVFKPLAALGFLWAAYAADALDTSYGQTVFVALALCAIGDICLIPKQVGRWFLIGLASFLLGHVAYAVAFIARGVETAWLWSSMVPLGVIALAVYRWLSSDVEDRMRTAVQAYIIVISAMVALAISTSAVDSAWLIAVGATMFWLSDISVACDRFKGAGIGNRAWGIPMYFCAQLVFALTILPNFGGISP